MRWQAERVRALREARRVVVKVGSAVLTNSEGLDSAVIHNLVAQLAQLAHGEGHGVPSNAGESPRRQVVLVSSGAVAAGRAALRASPSVQQSGSQPDTSGLAARQGAAAIGQSRLMQFYDTAFAAHGLVSAQVLLTRDDLRSRERFLNARNTFAELLSWDVIPVVNENDTVSVSELKFGDNDCLASLLVNLVEADLFINLTSAAGVMGSNPEADPNATILPCISSVATLDLDSMCGGKTSVGTGGMYSKLLAARRVAQLGAPTLILPGRQPDILTRALAQQEDDDMLGTWVCPDDHAISRRKFWLAYQSDPVGEVYVDAGAVTALLEKGSSLLPGGVVSATGSFQRGTLVRVVSEADGKRRSLGVGLSNYSAAELRRIMGLKRHEVAAILGDAHYPEVIHRDNMLLDAAV